MDPRALKTHSGEFEKIENVENKRREIDDDENFGEEARAHN
jgi:hypothetical protein